MAQVAQKIVIVTCHQTRPRTTHLFHHHCCVESSAVHRNGTGPIETIHRGPLNAARRRSKVSDRRVVIVAFTVHIPGFCLESSWGSLEQCYCGTLSLRVSQSCEIDVFSLSHSRCPRSVFEKVYTTELLKSGYRSRSVALTHTRSNVNFIGGNRSIEQPDAVRGTSDHGVFAILATETTV